MAGRRRPPKTESWYVAQWGPEGVRGSAASSATCYRTVRCESLEEAQAVAWAGANHLVPGAPNLAGARVSRILVSSNPEVPAFEEARWLLGTGGWVEV